MERRLPSVIPNLLKSLGAIWPDSLYAFKIKAPFSFE
ncbi:MAG: hypothetical protein RLZ23_249, partial [Actinomycetota bacterium]